jgi:hypothetical protein
MAAIPAAFHAACATSAFCHSASGHRHVFVGHCNVFEQNVVAADGPHADMIPGLHDADAWRIDAHHDVANLRRLAPGTGPYIHPAQAWCTSRENLVA